MPTPTPLTAIELLMDQHREVEQLFEELEDADADEKRDLCNQICDKLAIHATLEEKHFYPAVRAERTEDILLESLEEHVQIKRIIADILDEEDDERLDALAKVLEETVAHHVEEEETDLFPKVQRLFDDERLEALAQEMFADQVELEGKEPRLSVRGQTEEAARLP
jgi:hemerythrin-like domain-containing protein